MIIKRLPWILTSSISSTISLSFTSLPTRYNLIRNKYTFTKIRDLTERNIGDTIQVKGWVKNFRTVKTNYFFDLNDGSCNDRLQVIMDREIKRANPDLGYGAAVIVAGDIGTAPRGHLELRAKEFKLIGKCPTMDGLYPFNRSQTHTPEYIRNYLHLRPHIGSFRATLRARHLASQTFHRYFERQGFLQVNTPILTRNSCEGAGELFYVLPLNDELLVSMATCNPKQSKDARYFDTKTFLTISGQMHLEAMCQRLGSVYSFGPVFRAENSSSPIHMSEFYMIEAEESFVDGIDDITKRIESTIKTVTTELLDKNAKEIDEASITTKDQEYKNERLNWLQKPFPTITYAEAAEILEKHKSDFNAAEGLKKSDELFLVKHLAAPVFVVNWPKALKPFYMRTCKENPDLVEAIDFLMPVIGELAGGSVREDNVDILKENLPKDLGWYLDLRKYGGCTTGGFGIGFDRYLQTLLGIASIKDTIPFPRWPQHCQM